MPSLAVNFSLFSDQMCSAAPETASESDVTVCRQSLKSTTATLRGETNTENSMSSKLVVCAQKKKKKKSHFKRSVRIQNVYQNGKLDVIKTMI